MNQGTYKKSWGEFTLIRPLTSPVTEDVAGYAYQEGYVAIVRKKGLTSSNFSNKAFILPKTQKLVLLDSIELDDDSVTIYKTHQLQLFDVFSRIHLFSDSSKSFLTYYEHWDEKGDTVKYDSIPDCKFLKFGYGAKFSLGGSMDFDIGFLYCQMILDIDISGEIGTGLGE